MAWITTSTQQPRRDSSSFSVYKRIYCTSAIPSEAYPGRDEEGSTARPVNHFIVVALQQPSGIAYCYKIKPWWACKTTLRFILWADYNFWKQCCNNLEWRHNFPRTLCVNARQRHSSAELHEHTFCNIDLEARIRLVRFLFVSKSITVSHQSQ